MIRNPDSSGMNGRCAFAWRQMVVDPTGDVTPCCYYHSYAVGRSNAALGNVNSTDLLDIWNGEGYQALRRAHLEGLPDDHPCAHCITVDFNGGFPRFETGSGIEPEIGNCFSAQLTPETFQLASAAGAAIALLEDGMVVAEEQSLHDDIRQLGGGRFSLHRGHVLLSTSDNANPILSRRHIALRIDGEIRPIPETTFDFAAPSGRNMLAAYEDFLEGRAVMGAKPVFLGLASSVDCNIDCAYCSQNQFRAARLQLRPEVTDQAVALAETLSTFSWAGGEPFFLKPFRLFVETFDVSTNPNLVFGFTTNGTMLNKREWEKLDRFPRLAFSLSIDSFQRDSFERLRKGAKYDVVIGNLKAALARHDGTRRTVQVGMLVMKSNFLEIDRNVAFALDNGVELNLSPVLQYPINERIDIFTNFDEQARGWADALARACRLVAQAGEHREASYDLTQPLAVLESRLHSVAMAYRNSLHLEVEVVDETRALERMKAPCLLIGRSDMPLGYVELNRGAGRYWLQIPIDHLGDTGFHEWSLFHNIVEPWLPLQTGTVSFKQGWRRRLQELVRGSGEPRRTGPIVVVVPNFVSPAVHSNARMANFGQTAATGVLNRDGTQLQHSLRRRETAIQRIGLRHAPLFSANLRQFRPDGGHAFVAELPPLPSDLDSVSLLELSEDGVPLPMPRALHEDIRDLGQGRYSHWGGSLYLSTSDNSDPRMNGRTYSVAERPAGPRYSFDDTLTNTEQEQGFCFKATVNVPVESDCEGASSLVVFEDGVPLPGPHSRHEDIRTKGGGRYSHWRDHVYFSATDNSDVRTNGRIYTVDVGVADNQEEFETLILDASRDIPSAGPEWRADLATAVGRSPGARLVRRVNRLFSPILARLRGLRGGIGLIFRAVLANGGVKRGVVRMVMPTVAEPTQEYFSKLLAEAGAQVSDATPILGRIVLVCSTLGPGGAERQVVNTALALKQEGVDVRFVGLNLHLAPGNDFFLAMLREAGIAADDLGRPVSVGCEGVVSYQHHLAILLARLQPDLLEVVLSLAHMLRRERPEVLHAWLDETNIVAAIAGVLTGVPRIILSCRSVAPDNFPFHQPYMRPAYLALAALPSVTLLNNSHAGAVDYARWLGISPSAFRVVCNGFDLETLRPPPSAAVELFRRNVGLPDDRLVVGGIFRLGPEKRPFLWLDVARKVADAMPDCHFLMVGDGPLRAEAEAYGEKLGLGHRLHMVGVRDDIPAVLAALDVFLLTSAVEGLPNVLIEAQALGIPVVTTPAGGAPEAVADGRSGRVVLGVSATALAAAVLDLLGDVSLRHLYGTEGRVWVEERFGVDRMRQDTMAAYGWRGAR